jgi:replicative DNA helicase
MKHSNPETEAVILGALLDAEGMLRTTAAKLLADTGLVAEDFTDAFLRAAFGAGRALADRERPVDAQTVWTLLKGNADVTEASHKQLHELQGSNACNRAALSVHVLELKRLTRLRALEAFHREALKKLEAKAADPAHLAADLDTFARGFSGAEEDFYTGEADIDAIGEEWDAFYQGKRHGHLPTGVELLDGHVGGWPENLSVVAGASSGGKTALVATTILNAMESGHRIAVFGLEDGTKAMQRRYLALRAGLQLKQVGKSRLNEFQQANVNEAMPKLWHLAKNHLLSYQPKEGERIPSSKLLQLCKRAIIHHRVRAIFIDHGLEIEHESKHKGEEMRLRMDRTFAALRTLAFTNHVPIVVVLHLNRAGAKSEGPPRQEDLAECAGVERMSRLILGVWNLDGDQPGDMRVSIMKQTEGARRVNLMLNRELEQGLVQSTGGFEFPWPPPKPPKQRESGGIPWER